MHNIPSVILGANFYNALGAIRTLGRRGVPVYALDYHFPTAYALSSRYVTEKVLCPDINHNEKELADFLISFGKGFSVKPVLMAAADNYALMISRYAEELAPYFRFPAMPTGLLEKIIDKKGLSELARDLQLRIPITYTVMPGSDSDHIAGNINYPCIIKPALSHKFVRVFRQKCLYATDREKLMEALNTASTSGLEVMVQEVIPGFDDRMYVFDAYIDNHGKTTHTFSAQKLRQFPINFGSSTFTHQYYDPALITLGREYMERLGYRGYGEIEFKKDPRNEKYYLIEINARLSTLNVLFDKCGIEFTYIMYRDLIGDPLPEKHLTENMPWAFWHAYEDSISIFSYLKTKQLTIYEVLKPWFEHRKAHAIWAGDDIKPLFAFARLILSKIEKRLRRLFSKQEAAR
ncbi:MAG: carboxylate--amine ligase [Bacillota bacterium]